MITFFQNLKATHIISHLELVEGGGEHAVSGPELRDAWEPVLQLGQCCIHLQARVVSSVYYVVQHAVVQMLPQIFIRGNILIFVSYM